MTIKQIINQLSVSIKANRKALGRSANGFMLLTLRTDDAERLVKHLKRKEKK